MPRKKKSDDLEGQELVEPQPKKKPGRPKKSTTVNILSPADKPKREIEIRSALLRDNMFCTYVYDHNLPGSVTNGITVKSGLPVHDDMKDVFRRLKVHLALTCEEIDPSDISDINGIGEYDPDVHNEGEIEQKVSLFRVFAWRLDGAADKEGLILTGEKVLSTGDSVKLETPKIKWTSSSPFIGDLQLLIHQAIVEVEEYQKGKRAPDRQQELPFGQSPVDMEEEVSELTNL